jgi:heme-degrading monooxygenase HmoA
MYASVTTGRCQPGKVNEWVERWRESVKPMVEGFPGVRNVYVLTNPDKDTGMTIALYETEADAERTQTSGDFQEAVAALADLMVLESIVREGYEVNIVV